MSAFTQAPFRELPTASASLPSDRDLTGELLVLPGLLAFIDAEHVELTDGKVSRAVSIAPGGHDFVQTTASRRPTIVANALGGRPVFDFNGSRLDLVGGFPSSGSWTIYLALRVNPRAAIAAAAARKGATTLRLVDASSVAAGQRLVGRLAPLGTSVQSVAGQDVTLTGALLRDIDAGATLEFVALPGTTTYLIGATTPATSAHSLYISSGNVLTQWIEQASGVNQAMTIGADLTRWLFIAASYDSAASTARLRVGAGATKSAAMNAGVAFETNLYIAANDGLTIFFRGRVAAAGLFDVDHLGGARDAEALVVADYMRAAYGL